MRTDMIRWTLNQMPSCEEHWLSLMAPSEVEWVQSFHRSFPQYQVTPLHSLPAMARMLGLDRLYVKDESHRFGLNAFKVLGGSYAIARYMAQRLELSADQLSFASLNSPEMRQVFGEATFFTATDGNHGRGVAWAARQLGQRAVVRMPAGTSYSRLENIRREGADVTIEPMNYDECVRLAAREAADTAGSVVVQDTAWPGYEEIPCWIMQGYGTMVAEALKQLQADGTERPTHVFVQAGVGSLAGAVAGGLVNLFPEEPPRIVVVEAAAADCHYRSALNGDGRISMVSGELDTMMAGLACGEPNPISWEILRNHAHAFVSCPDWVSALGMRMLAAPQRGDAQIISGESGAVCMGLVAAAMNDPMYHELREALKLNEHSRVLLFSTEGDTDPANYRRVVWGWA